ncbi:MAG: hypothetical protein WC895_05555 [Candidatus Shapirobacteria bacterium]|jgi:hypothetical protein
MVDKEKRETVVAMIVVIVLAAAATIGWLFLFDTSTRVMCDAVRCMFDAGR